MTDWLLYTLKHTTVFMKFPQGLNDKPVEYQTNRGVKQGCPLSPILYALFNDTLLRWLTKMSASPYLQDIPTALAYADDLAILSHGDYRIIRQQVAVLNKWEDLTQQSLNTDKTKILTTDWQNPEPVHNPKHFQVPGRHGPCPPH
jgi:hypothetical protein